MPGDDNGSAVLRFTLDELTSLSEPIHLKPETEDPHVLAMFTTKVNETEVDNGTDGVDFDSDGNLYTGSFGDGAFYKMTLNDDGTLASQETIMLTGDTITCIDGFVIDRNTNKAYVAGSRQNAIFVIDMATMDVTTLAQNPDTDGGTGKIDQPAEVLLVDNRLYVTNYDNPEKNFMNTESDAPRTESYIDLE